MLYSSVVQPCTGATITGRFRMCKPNMHMATGTATVRTHTARFCHTTAPAASFPATIGFRTRMWNCSTSQLAPMTTTVPEQSRNTWWGLIRRNGKPPYFSSLVRVWWRPPLLCTWIYYRTVRAVKGHQTCFRIRYLFHNIKGITTYVSVDSTYRHVCNISKYHCLRIYFYTIGVLNTLQSYELYTEWCFQRPCQRAKQWYFFPVFSLNASIFGPQEAVSGFRPVVE